MNTAPRPIPPGPEPLASRSLGAVAAALVTCKHPSRSHVRLFVDMGSRETGIHWCAACGALRTQDPPDPLWHTPSMTSAFRREAFEELVLLLHAVMQLAQLAQSHASAGAAGSPAHIVLRSLSRSLSELARLPVVRDIARLERALAKIPPHSICPSEPQGAADAHEPRT